jgi:hypothetical protein
MPTTHYPITMITLQWYWWNSISSFLMDMHSLLLNFVTLYSSYIVDQFTAKMNSSEEPCVKIHAFLRCGQFLIHPPPTTCGRPGCLINMFFSSHDQFKMKQQSSWYDRLLLIDDVIEWENGQWTPHKQLELACIWHALRAMKYQIPFPAQKKQSGTSILLI